MKEAIRYCLQVAYGQAVKDNGNPRIIPSAITLRREVRDLFYSRYDYARHHINPVCKSAVAILRSYKKNHHGDLRIPDVKKLVMRIDEELFKIVFGRIRITLQPKRYSWIQINASNKHYGKYSRGKPSELLITDEKICLTFVVRDSEKPLARRFVASDLNFATIDSTVGKSLNEETKIESVNTQSIKRVIQIQNDFSRRRRMIQMHITNPQMRVRKLRETRGRQRNRINDVLHKLSTEYVKTYPDASFIFENLKGIRRTAASKKGKKLRTYLNRWPYRMFQSMIEYKSTNRTLYVSPRGTSSECPVCGGKLEHPAWVVSRCMTCGVDYDRDKLASLAIFCRGLRLCGQPFAVSADTSWKSLKNEYLHTGSMLDAPRASGTEASSAPSGGYLQDAHP